MKVEEGLFGLRYDNQAKRLTDLESVYENLWLKVQLNSNFSVVIAIAYFDQNYHTNDYKLVMLHWTDFN